MRCMCALTHVCGSAHMCNRCVISDPGPHHGCQHVGCSACVWWRIVLHAAGAGRRLSIEPPHFHVHFSPNAHLQWKGKKKKQKQCTDTAEFICVWGGICIWLPAGVCLYLWVGTSEGSRIIPVGSDVNYIFMFFCVCFSEARLGRRKPNLKLNPTFFF